MKDKWGRYDYLQQQVLVLSVEANYFFTDKENELMLSACKDEATDEEKKMYRDLLTEEIAKNTEPRRLRYDRIYDRESLSLDINNREYYTDETGEHYHVIVPDYISADKILDIKTDLVSSEFVSEFHRVLDIEPGSFFVRRIIIHWKNTDLAAQLLKYGIIIRIKENDIITEEHFSLFTASAGQMRTSKFSLVADSLMPIINKRLFCGMTIDKINAKKKMLSSKLLAYRALGCSASERWYNPDGTKFSIRQCVVVPDFTYHLKDIIVDNISADKIERINVGLDEIMPFIEQNSNDGMGLVLPGVLPHNIDTCINRSPFIKGLLTEFDFLGFCNYYSVEPIVTDFWGKKHNLKEENIKVILTESMFKLAAWWDSWEDYCKDWEDGDCYMCFLQAAATKEEDTYSPLSYQMFQPLAFMTEEEMQEILEQPMAAIQRMTCDKSTILNVLGADERSTNARDRALAAYPELMKLTEWRKDLIEGIRAKIDNTRASKFNLGVGGKLNRRLFVVREPWALCRYWFLGDDSGTGFCEANQICCKAIANDYSKVALSRSPGLFLDAVIVDVVPDNKNIPEQNNPYYWYKTNCIYMSCKDGAYLSMNFDEDGDMLNVSLAKPYINALERTIKEFDTVVNYYPGLTGEKSEITIDTLTKSIIVAHEGNIGTISNSLTKLWNSPRLAEEVKKKMTGRKYHQNIIDDYMKAGKALLLKNQYMIDLAKTNFLPSLSDELQSNIDNCIGKRTKMPYFFKYTNNFTNNEQHRDMNEAERAAACEKYSGSICDRICDYVYDKSIELGIMNANGNINIDFSFLRGYDYHIFYGSNSDVERDPRVITTWKQQCQRFSFSRIKKENAKEAAICKTTTDIIKARKIMTALEQLDVSKDVIYYTLVDYLFKDNAFAESCGSNKYFWCSYLGDMAASIIESNVKSGHYDKQGSFVDQILCRCSNCGNTFTPKSMKANNTSGNHDGILFCSICKTNAEKERNEKKHATRDKKIKEEKDKILVDFIENLRRISLDEDKFFKIIRENNIKFKENNKSTIKITTKLAKNIANDLHILEEKNEKYFERKIKI